MLIDGPSRIVSMPPISVGHDRTMRCMSAQSSSLRSWGKLKSTMCWSISAVPVRSSGRQLSRLNLEQAGGQVLGRHLRQGQERLGPLYAVDLPDLLEQQPAQVAV